MNSVKIDNKDSQLMSPRQDLGRKLKVRKTIRGRPAHLDVLCAFNLGAVSVGSGVGYKTFDFLIWCFYSNLINACWELDTYTRF